MNPVIQALGRRLRLGVVGGSHGFIGPVHRTAARLDDLFEIAAGVLSSDPERGRAAAAAIGLPTERAYPTVEAMLAAERQRPDGIDAVAIMTPNALHFGAAMAALDAGLDVICDKPLTTSLADALALVAQGAGDRPGLLHDLQLQRLPDGPAGARHGPGRRDRRGPAGPPHLRAGPQRRAWSRPSRAGRPGGSTRRRPAPPSSWATSARTRTTSAPTSPASSSRPSWPRSPPPCRAAPRTTMPASCCAGRAGCRARCG